MSRPNTSSQKDGTLLTLTADDFSDAVGAALKAAETHTGKPAGKKQVALNAAAKVLSGPRANWGALKAKNQVVTNSARSCPTRESSPVELDETQYKELPRQVVFDEFGLFRYDLKGEAELRRSFAPVFARGVSVVSIPLRFVSLPDSPQAPSKWFLYDRPLFLDHNLEPFHDVHMSDLGLALNALDSVEGFETDILLSHLFRSDIEPDSNITMHVTQMGTLFVGMPSVGAFQSSFCEPTSRGLTMSETFHSTYANIRSSFGPANIEWEVDDHLKDRTEELPVFWFVDPKMPTGLLDSDLLLDLVLTSYSKLVWKNCDGDIAPQNVKALLQHIARRAKEPYQERFPRKTFMMRHYTWESEILEREDPQRGRSVISRIGELFS